MEKKLISDLVAEHTDYFRDQFIRLTNIKRLNQYVLKGQILFTGSSLMEQFPVAELATSHQLGKVVYNRGIGGYNSDDFLAQIDPMLFDLEPSKVFLNIGTNDMYERADGEDWLTHLLNNYRKIFDLCREKLPNTEFYIMAFYPVNRVIPAAQGLLSNMLKVRTRENLALANENIKALTEEYGYHYIDVNDGLTDEDGSLKEDFTVEGVHMFSDAYEVVYQNLQPYL